TSTQSITRRDLLKADQKISDAVPLVVFMDDGGDRYYASPVTINSGPWRLRLEASNPDPNAYVNDFIYARFWFVPEDYSFNYIEPHKYRDQTEF
ncbi:hypothetical protein ACKI16_46385, partial [Streptomyces scabiei]|uniref:hypothetical protein n=1 Tax=Streptomyces scabiei TaxID=1930 RepID=UPI0038F66A94